MQAFLIVVFSILACIVYGIIHDQFTVRICLEYFTIGHAPVFNTEDPTLLALGWGVRATWWVGLFIGIPLATFARIGSRPKRSAISLIRPMLLLFGCTAVLATVTGVMALVGATNGWLSLHPEMAAQLPPDKHAPFLVDLWIHNTSYTSGFVGGVFVMAWVWWTRIEMEQGSRTQIEIGDSLSHST